VYRRGVYHDSGTSDGVRPLCAGWVRISVSFGDRIIIIARREPADDIGRTQRFDRQSSGQESVREPGTREGQRVPDARLRESR